MSAEAELTGDWEQSTLWLCRNDGGGPSAFLHAAEGILIDSPCRVEIKPGCHELIEHWLQPVDGGKIKGVGSLFQGSVGNQRGRGASARSRRNVANKRVVQGKT